MKHKEEHIKSGRPVCPFCRNENGIEGDFVEIDGNTARQEVFCTECGGAWQDIYVLKDAEIVCVPEKEEVV